MAEPSPAKKKSLSTKPTQQLGPKYAVAISLLALTLAILSAVMFFYFYSQKHSSNSTLKSQLQQNQITALVEFKNLQSQLKEQNEQINRTQASLANILQSNSQSPIIQTLNSISFLIHAANLSIQSTNNTNAALNSLLQAKSALKKLNASDYIQLSESISTDIDKIKQRQRQFKPEVYIAKLQQLDRRVQALDFIPTANHRPTKNQQTLTDNTDTHQSKRWYQPVVTALHALRGLIIIRKQASPLYQVLSQSDIQMIKQNISIKISLAQWAISKSNRSAFQQNMTAIESILHQTLKSNVSTQNLLGNIRRLRQINFPTQPIHLSSLVSITSIISSSTNSPQQDAHSVATKEK